MSFGVTNSSTWRLIDIEYDSQTTDFFYLGYINENDYDSSNSDEPVPHFISRMDHSGNLVWGKGYVTNYNYSSHNTLQYSSSDQALYYVIHTDPISLVKANSSNGEILNTYHLHDDPYYHATWHNFCSLSDDELAYY